MDRKKQLKEQYRQMKPEMGIYAVRNNLNNKCHLESTANLRASINGTKFKLEAGNHPNRELQQAWNESGAANFTIEILENLDYDKDETKTDYSEDLALLQMIWTERLAKQNQVFYQK